MSVLLLAEVTDGELSVDVTAKTAAAAKSLGDVTVFRAGASAEAAAKIDGVASVLLADNALYSHRPAGRDDSDGCDRRGGFRHV